MALTSKEQLFVKRPLYRCFLRNDHSLFTLECERSYNFHLSPVFLYWRFLVSVQQKNEIKKGNTLMEFKYLLFWLSIDLFHVKDFKRNLTDGNLIRKMSLKRIWCWRFYGEGVFLRNGFWVVSTVQGSVWKQLKRSINCAHTLLADCCRKLWPRFF